jgi:hypothetical protein
MKIVISFPIDSFYGSSNALKFIHENLNLKISKITSDISFIGGSEGVIYSDVVNMLDINGDKLFTITLEENENNQGNVRVTFRKDPSKFAELFIVDLEDSNQLNLDAFIINAARFQLSTVCKFDFQKAKWQSEEYISNFIYHKRSHAHLLKISNPNLPPVLKDKVDIFQNPGHQKLTYNMYLMAAPEIWFGPGSLKYFDKNRLLSFPDAEDIQEISNNVLYIKLFDWNIPDYETDRILNLQRGFRQWVEMDEIELKLDKLVKNNKDDNNDGILTETKIYK